MDKRQLTSARYGAFYPGCHGTNDYEAAEAILMDDKRKRTRRTKIDLGCVEAKTAWSDSKLVFVDYDEGGDRKEVILNIRYPYEITYLRNELNKIVKYWKDKVNE